MKSSVFEGIRLVFRKEITMGMRFRASWLTMLMFSLTTLSCVSLALQGGVPEPELQAALLWIILFFSAMTGVDRLFLDEEMGGTLPLLRIYASSQGVLFGKMLYALFLLSLMTLFVVMLFLIFMGAEVTEAATFFSILALGAVGLAGAGTVIAALAAGAGVRSGLFPVLMLPVLLPVLLPAIGATSEVFGGKAVTWAHLGGMAFYDVLLILGASVLFDYFWYEE